MGWKIADQEENDHFQFLSYSDYIQIYGYQKLNNNTLRYGKNMLTKFDQNRPIVQL